ncbi:ABC transporter permease [Candidatus Chloroploca sp. M-50]|uniref:ABC transporter permease n=1 Tax=Candidatus Chloroploca mongolica TaxID=2528176 RepID=A0ABS4DGT7_9CHLR|nr:ABC transporter permease [Candidatus Chloroploca mongolica]MBP1468638.1 ABC transporter permease [Candidatus Chloroploca mongolica]
MYYRVIYNDIVKNKAITLTTMLFVAVAAMLVTLAAILMVNLSGAIDALMTRAQTPHFMQMHAGTLDRGRLTAFAAQHEAVAAVQIVEFLNLDGAQIVFPGGSLARSVQDHGFVVQNEQFDFLLDLDGEIIRVADGELYVPVNYLQDGTTMVGERVEVAGKPFIVAGFLRDAQMNSLLSSSKRFLVSQNDFAALEPVGTMEYLIEFRLHDLEHLGAFEATYTAADFEANGPTITDPLYRMLNGLSDGLMIAVLLLVSALVVAVAFLCIRFTLLAKIEDDYREIGVMKAIGLRVADIKRIYLATYAAIAAVGSLLGFALALLFQGVLLEQMRLFFGESGRASLALLLGAVSVLLVFLAIIAYVNGMLGRFHHISPGEAIRFGIAQEKASGGKRFHLSMNTWLSTNLFLGVKDVLARTKLYATMLVVLVLAAFIIIVPQNLANTIAAKSFSTYMGVGNSDLRFDLQQTDQIAAKAAAIATALADDSDIAAFVVLTTQTFSVRLEDGSEERIKVELGDHTVFPLAYAAGRAPLAENEIALSVMHANEMGKNVGDSLTLRIAGHERDLSVCGIYSDVTNGGKTAKAIFTDASANIMWSVISAELVDPTLLDAKRADYSGRFTFAKVSDLDEFIAQTYGPTISGIGKAAYAALGIALTIALLITLLFMRMLVAKDRYAIAVMKAFGFTNTDIQVQYIVRAVCVLVVGIALGTILANTLGEALAGAVIASFGAASFTFVINPLFAYLLSPLLLTVVTLAATIVGTFDAGRISIAEHIKE